MAAIKVVDLFAGPGGLGEGFAAFPFDMKLNRFKICLSIEKNPIAAQTLLLRSFIRQFSFGNIPDLYYDLLSRSDIPLDLRLTQLYSGKFHRQYLKASEEACCIELGESNQKLVKAKVKAALKGQKNWVLVGGPPCQAYSVVGRSRNKGKQDYQADKDSRQFLYKEYLRVISDHKPAVFVMENVKGLLSATVSNQKIFESMISDLKNPSNVFKEHSSTGKSDEYVIFSIVKQSAGVEEDSLSDYLVKMEEFGVPQARHRVILLGVRRDIAKKATPRILSPAATATTTRQTIGGLPKRLRSGISQSADNSTAWLNTLRESKFCGWAKQVGSDLGQKVLSKINTTVDELTAPRLERGGEFVNRRSNDSRLNGPLCDWFADNCLDGTLNHTTRSHIPSDLHRYFFASLFAQSEKRSPTLSDFPDELLPAHKNVNTARSGSNFADRFRVQVANRPSTTITCHISKDGHYYIHYDPTQCRSLTVREAARLQTFPDNYFFCGPRTAQYIQVGNAVPPYLSHQIAEIVYGLLKDAKAI